MDARASGTPESIGRFRVESILGSGGMGEVYKAIDPTLQRIVAVKTVRPRYLSNPDYLDRLVARGAGLREPLTIPTSSTVLRSRQDRWRRVHGDGYPQGRRPRLSSSTAAG